MFWLSIVLALLASAITLSGTSVLLGVPILALCSLWLRFRTAKQGKACKGSNSIPLQCGSAIVVSILALVAAPLLAIPQ